MNSNGKKSIVDCSRSRCKSCGAPTRLIQSCWGGTELRKLVKTQFHAFQKSVRSVRDLNFFIRAIAIETDLIRKKNNKSFERGNLMELRNISSRLSFLPHVTPAYMPVAYCQDPPPRAQKAAGPFLSFISSRSKFRVIFNSKLSFFDFLEISLLYEEWGCRLILNLTWGLGNKCSCKTLVICLELLFSELTATLTRNDE